MTHPNDRQLAMIAAVADSMTADQEAAKATSEGVELGAPTSLQQSVQEALARQAEQ